MQQKLRDMAIPSLYSAQRIKQQFHTGEEPVLVMCSDANTYVCKYMRSSSAAYKLACEFVGAYLASIWQLRTPEIALVTIKPRHWEGINISHSVTAAAIGGRWLDGMVDITPSTYTQVPSNSKSLKQLLKIALFDFWVANEDRNANNANLMYDAANDELVSIDYGCIFNTATYDYPISQLTSTDTILWSDFFQHLSQSQDEKSINEIIDWLEKDYEKCLDDCRQQVGDITSEMPKEWKVPTDAIDEKIKQLLDKQWTAAVWDNFIECLNENIE